MVQVLLPARLLQEAGACALLGAALGAARAFLPVRGRAAFVPDMLLSGAVLLACQSYAAGYSTAGVLRWYMVVAALAAARDAGALVCFVPCLRPALWPGAEAMAETVRLFLPRADVVVLTEQELPPLFRTDAPRAALWHLLRGHTRLVVLAGAEGVHAFTRERLAFRPGPCPGAETLAAGVLRQLSALSQARQALPKLTQAQLDALPSF